MKKIIHNLILCGAVCCVLLIFLMFNFSGIAQQEPDRKFLNYSDFLKASKDKSIGSIEIKKDTIKGTFTDGTQFVTKIPPDEELADLLSQQDLGLRVALNDDIPSFIRILLTWLPMLLLMWLWVSFVFVPVVIAVTLIIISFRRPKS